MENTLMNRSHSAAVLLVIMSLCGGCVSVEEEETTSAALAPAASDPSLAPVSWLTGVWRATDGDTITQEYWTGAEGGTMLGAGRTIKSGKTIFFEYLRIEKRADGIVYLASPKGRQPPTEFRYNPSASDANTIIFENPAHDFPQRITYRLLDTGEAEVSIDGIEHGQKHEKKWRFQRLN
jgi:hypothetical protein